MSYQEEMLKQIADAIRKVEGTEEKIPANQFASRVAGLGTGGGEYNIEQTFVDGGCELHITDAKSDTTLYHCMAIDYDGTILKEGWYSKGQEFVLPEIPSHDRLTSQGWVASSTIVDNKVIVDGDLSAGIVYTTKSGLTEFDIILTQNTGLTFTLNLDGLKDWGDGTSDTTTSHIYASYGKYTVSCNVTQVITNQSADSYIGLFDSYAEEGNSSCVAIRTGNNVTRLGDLMWTSSISYITLSNSVTSLRSKIDGAICDSTMFEALIVPSSVVDFYGVVTANRVVLPIGITTIGSLSGCEDLVIPNTVSTIGALTTINTKKLFFPSSVRNINNISTSAETIEFADGVVSVKNISDFASNKIVFSNTITSVGNITNGYIDKLIFPSGITSLGKITDCKYLREVVLPDNLTSLVTDCFKNCLSISKIVFPTKLTTLPSSLPKVYSAYTLDFSKCENVCTSAGIGNWVQFPLTQVIVPDNLYDAWVADSNWSKYASQIKKASEV